MLQAGFADEQSDKRANYEEYLVTAVSQSLTGQTSQDKCVSEQTLAFFSFCLIFPALTS